MTSIPKFDSEIYSEELYNFTESEYDEVMAASAEDDFAGYADWSAELENGDAEKLSVKDEKLYHKPDPLSLGRIGGVKI